MAEYDLTQVSLVSENVVLVVVTTGLRARELWGRGKLTIGTTCIFTLLPPFVLALLSIPTSTSSSTLTLIIDINLTRIGSDRIGFAGPRLSTFGIGFPPAFAYPRLESSRIK